MQALFVQLLLCKEPCAGLHNLLLALFVLVLHTSNGTRENELAQPSIGETFLEECYPQEVGRVQPPRAVEVLTGVETQDVPVLGHE